MLNLRTFLIRERVGMLRLTDHYDIFDPDSNEKVGEAREEISGLIKALRFLVSKKLLPTVVNVYGDDDETPVFSITRGVALFRPRVEITNADGKLLGYFKAKMFSLGGGFWLFDRNDNQFAEVKGDWKGWNFKLLSSDGQLLGTVAKKWAGLAKEMFTSADNYVVALGEHADDSETTAMLLLAAGLAIDTVFKEKG